MAAKWTEAEVKFLEDNYPEQGLEYCRQKVHRTVSGIKSKIFKLGLKLEDAGKRQRNAGFKTYLDFIKNTEYECLETFDSYRDNHTPILTRHKTCGHEWKISYNNLRRIKNCPNCSKTGFKPLEPTYLYFIYFSELNLYKIGITVDWETRKRQFGYIPELLGLEKFETGIEAKQAEFELKQSLTPYKVDTGLLKSGNTETFLWP